MDTRLARLETGFDWMRWTLTVMVAAMIGILAFVGVQVTRVDNKMDALSADVHALPEKLNASIREANRSFADAVNASLTVFAQRFVQPAPAQPIVIQLPAPTPAPEQPKPEAPK